MNIIDKIKPETELERKIVEHPDFACGALYGKPRRGHPEGKVIYHIVEVLKNVNKFSSGNDREKLRLIALIHDTFKYKVDRSKPKCGENHHGMIARRFAENFIDNRGILDIIELHDEAYNAWNVGNRKGRWSTAERRVNSLVKRLGNNLSLYTLFYKCDNLTGNKTQDNYNWFVSKTDKSNITQNG